ncbi:hypothetical protein LCGC14_2006430 [marine sediment metagenome]|uniref:Uncharacterized protein n=1 Tax=marine sediment metagenome TaxID=412755 RepID=A0A0F9HYR5_9ZZZZ
MLFLTKGWMLAAFMAAIAGASLGLAGLSPTNVMAGVSHSHVYTHNSSSCAGHVDPINDVFEYSGFASWVKNHAAHHGGWWWGDGSNQWFYAHQCRKQNYHAASNSQFDPGGRYHMRIGYGYTASGGSDYDSTWRYWSTADAHHEDMTWCGHAVDDNNREPPGGFNRGRDDVWVNWSFNGPHVWDGWQYWGNIARFTQCNGNVAWSDGWVDFIEVRTSS